MSKGKQHTKKWTEKNDAKQATLHPKITIVKKMPKYLRREL